MQHNDEAFAAMLLTLPLSAEGEEAVKPLSGREFGSVCGILGLNGDPVSTLIGRDVSWFMRVLRMNENEAYRMRILLSREMLLYKLLDDTIDRGIDVVTPFHDEYPAILKARMGGIQAPPLFIKGDTELFKADYVGIMGIEGVKTPEHVLTGVRDLVDQAAEYGFGIATENTLGACRAARHAAMTEGGELLARLICVLDGGLTAACEKYEKYTSEGTALLVSPAHPDAPAGTKDAAKVLCALSCAAFIATTDGKRDEAEIAKQKLCDYLYVFDAPELPGNTYAASKGFECVTRVDVPGSYDKWTGKRGEQLSFL